MYYKRKLIVLRKVTIYQCSSENTIKMLSSIHTNGNLWNYKKEQESSLCPWHEKVGL